VPAHPYLGGPYPPRARLVTDRPDLPRDVLVRRGRWPDVGQ